MQSVAVVRQIARYPVKSMKAELLQTTTLTLQGVPEDRRYAFVQAVPAAPSHGLPHGNCRIC